MTELTTRRPTGKPPWPILLLAGAEKAGKSWSCAVASGSPLIGRTLWVGIGEDDPDEYGSIPGADFEIVEHDGTYRGILAALTACAQQPPVDGRPVLVVVDSMTRLWDLLCDDAQATANTRARRKAEKSGRAPSPDDATISMDLWNTAKQRWSHCLDALREHNGPVLLTARLERVTVMDGKGEPTTEKEWKVKAEKSLPFDVGGIVEMPEPGKAAVRGVRSARMQATARTDWPGFTVNDLWIRLGLADDADTSPRRHQANTVTGEDDLTGDIREEQASSSSLTAALAGVELAETEEHLKQVWQQHAGRLSVTDRSTFSAAVKARRGELNPPEPDETAAPPTRTETAETDGRPVTRGQLADLAQKFADLGVTGKPADRPIMVAICTGMTGRTIRTRADLTSAECGDIADALAECLAADDPAAAFADLLAMARARTEQAAERAA